MQDKFFTDLKTLYAKSGPWDLVLFTGDLTYQGGAEEFEKVDSVLEKLWKHLDRLGPKPSLLAVPGNHDLTRPDSSQPAVILLQEWSARQGIRSDFWNNPTSPYRRVVKAAFRNYLSWWDRQRLKPPGVNVGMLPGDFSFTLTKGAAKLGVVGLNTAFLQLTAGDYKGKLDLSARQFHAACGGDSGPEWAREHHACLLLTHQPQEWLTPDSQKDFNAEIADPGQFAVHLFGHMHEPFYNVVSVGGAEARCFWQGRSLFGLEYFVGHDDTQAERLHGYSAGRIELNEKDSTGSVTFWPREARRIQGGAWRVVRDQSYVLTEEDCVEPRRINLLKPFGATAGSTTEDVVVVFAQGEQLLQPFGATAGSTTENVVVVFGQGEQLLKSTARWERPEVSFRRLSKEEE